MAQNTAPKQILNSQLYTQTYENIFTFKKQKQFQRYKKPPKRLVPSRQALVRVPTPFVPFVKHELVSVCVYKQNVEQLGGCVAASWS